MRDEPLILNGSEYSLSKATNIYVNRSLLIPSDEEITMLLGVEQAFTPSKVNVLVSAHMALPGFLRTYDSFKTVLDDFRDKGIIDGNSI